MVRVASDGDSLAQSPPHELHVTPIHRPRDRAAEDHPARRLDCRVRRATNTITIAMRSPPAGSRRSRFGRGHGARVSTMSTRCAESMFHAARPKRPTTPPARHSSAAAPRRSDVVHAPSTRPASCAGAGAEANQLVARQRFERAESDVRSKRACRRSSVNGAGRRIAPARGGWRLHGGQPDAREPASSTRVIERRRARSVPAARLAMADSVR